MQVGKPLHGRDYRELNLNEWARAKMYVLKNYTKSQNLLSDPIYITSNFNIVFNILCTISNHLLLS